jgi:Bucentaur or craniofacial development
VIDKSADDWQGFKSQNAEVKDELNEYNKSSAKYLERQAFLKRAELTEYEAQRDAKLQSDIRTRARA